MHSHFARDPQPPRQARRLYIAKPIDVATMFETLSRRIGEDAPTH